MRVSFDFGGTLDKHPDLIRLAHQFLRDGHDVYLLSGVKDDTEVSVRKQFLKQHGLCIPELYTRPDSRGGDRAKAVQCQARQIDLHFDNAPRVVAAMRELSPSTMVVLVR